MAARLSACFSGSTGTVCFFVSPVSRSQDAETVLKAAGVPVESLYIQTLGHGIDDSGIAMGGNALRAAFA